MTMTRFRSVRLAVVLALAFPLLLSVGKTAGPPQSGQAAAAPQPAADAQRCAALAPARISRGCRTHRRASCWRASSTCPRRIRRRRPAVLAASPIKQYCQVMGYVAPQNKFELRLPLPAQWNQRFHLTPCAGFCGGVNGNACNHTLARGYASITGNGGHDGSPAFDGVWAANSPEPAGRFRVAAQSRHHRGGQGDHHEVLRPADRALVHDRVLEGRPRGADGSAALPRGLRRAAADRPGLRSDRPDHGRRVERAGGRRRTARVRC